MKDISLHLMDIAQNSIVAGADRIRFNLKVYGIPEKLYFEITDNGKGMDREFLKAVADPFKTTRTTREVGLGILLLKQSAQMAEGELVLHSEPGKGTTLQASFMVNHIDRIPLGDMAGTFALLMAANKNISWIIEFSYQNKNFILDTDKIKEMLDGVPIDNHDVLKWIQNTINEGLNSVFGGVLNEVN